MKGVGGGTRLGETVRMDHGFSVRVTYPRVVCGAALLANDVRLPSRVPLLSSIIDGWTMGGAAATLVLNWAIIDM